MRYPISYITVVSSPFFKKGEELGSTYDMTIATSEGNNCLQGEVEIV